MGKLIRVIFLLYLPTNLLYSQTIISGTVKNDSKNALAFVSVILKDSLTNSTLSYTSTDDNGHYTIKADKLGNFYLNFTSLGFDNKTIRLNLETKNQQIKRDVILNEKHIELNEVILQTETPISVGKDTINFKTKFFVDGTEQTVEDLLKKIPGLHIESDGVIKVNNQEIEKLMIDGDDFFEKGYRILSKNMPAYPIEEVEVLKNYSNNKLLKGIEESERVALNLKLNEESKRIWFGNVEASIGNDSHYQLKMYLMNFGKKNKYYFLNDFNTLDYDVSGVLESLIRPFRANEPSSIGDNQSLRSLVNLDAQGLGFSKKRSTFNNTKTTSLNAIFNPTEKLKIKTLGFFNFNKNNFQRISIDKVFAEGVNFTNTEDYDLHNRKKTAFGKLEALYDISKTKMLESITKYNYGDFTDTSYLVFNGLSTTEDLQHQIQLFDQKISYTNKFKNKKAFLLTGRFINEKAPQDYAINKFSFQNLFPQTNNANNVLQFINNQMQFAGIEAHLLDRNENGNLLELKVGNEFRKDKLSTQFLILDESTVQDTPDGYQNNTNYLVNDLYFISKYRLKVKKIGFNGNLSFNQLYNQLKSSDETTKQNKLFITPSFGVDWEINKRNNITVVYSYNFTNTNLLDIYSDYILRASRTFSKGTGELNQLYTSNIMFNYQLGNWSDRFFINTNIAYSTNRKFYSTNTTINQNYVQSESLLINDRKNLNFGSSLDYFIKALSSNLKLELGYSESDYKNIINNSDLREVSSRNYRYGLELRSTFYGFFNFHLGTKWTTNEVNTSFKSSFTDNNSFLNMSFIFSPKFNLQLQSERYVFGNLETDNSYYFLDFNVQYKLIENKLILGLIGKNIFDTDKFKTSYISDIGSYTSEYRLLPLHIVLKIEYRF